MAGPQAGDTLAAAALKVMLQPDPMLKAAYTQQAVQLWQTGAINRVCDKPLLPSEVPDRPARQCDQVQLVAPGAMPKLGKGGTLASRQAILHSLVHIELAAVDLSWDIIVRFGTNPAYQLPKAFFDDFVQVAADEASHFSLLKQRLEAVGSHYGALPAHDGLWESAQTTAHSLPARLAVEHCVHEARGLDVLPATVQKFRGNGDSESAALLEDVIYAEEISHCAAGVRWLKYLHNLAHNMQQLQQAGPAAAQAGEQQEADRHLQDNTHHQQQKHQQQQQKEDQQARDQPSVELQSINQETCVPSACAQGAGGGAAGGSVCVSGASEHPDWVADALQHSTVEAWFRGLIRSHFKGSLKPPFNEVARAKAGFGPAWYLPLATAAHQPRTGPAVAPGAAAADVSGGACIAAHRVGKCEGSATVGQVAAAVGSVAL